MGKLRNESIPFNHRQHRKAAAALAEIPSTGESGGLLVTIEREKAGSVGKERG